MAIHGGYLQDAIVLQASGIHNLASNGNDFAQLEARPANDRSPGLQISDIDGCPPAGNRPLSEHGS